MIPFVSEPSGAQKLLGYETFWQPGEGKARCILALRAEVLNRGKALHGGIAVTLLDTACGIACEASIADKNCTELYGHGAVTVDLYSQFVSNCSVGVVTAEAEVTRCGGGLIFVRADLRDETGKLLTTATGTFKRLRRAKTL